VKRFALIGASGYIAPRHMKAIKDTGHVLVAALDPFDSVGVMDSYFPQCEFFTQPEAFADHLEDLKRVGQGVDFVAITSPNHLHESHIRMALRAGADALCEKPLVLDSDALSRLAQLEQETKKRVYTILQLRTHPALVKLKNELSTQAAQKHEVELSYITSRGTWYLRSWKGKLEQSGGLASNIGVHFFDMLSWLYGDLEKVEVHERDDTVAAGYLEFTNAKVKWFLSIDSRFVPEHLQAKGQRTYRSITMNGTEIEFSEGFTDLHTAVYQRTLTGNGFGLEDTAQAIRAVEQIRKMQIVTNPELQHPFLEARA
jgi:UDP-N-acetyl-2-amino-2-deoxyglucuronate dehydrogenase